MKTLSITAFTFFIIILGVYLFLKNENTGPNQILKKEIKEKNHFANNSNSPIYKKNIRDLDKIGKVINEKNVKIDQYTKVQIKIAKKVFDIAEGLRDKKIFLEQSYMDQGSSITDIKHLQNEIVEINNNLKLESTNTEKWNPKLVYYLMIHENYTYQEINAIKSLSENGLNADEITYVNELIKETAFMDKIKSFKNQESGSRTVASSKMKEKDDFIENPEVTANAESKLIEMNYNQEDQ